MPVRTRSVPVAAGLLVSLLALGACGDDDTSDAAASSAPTTVDVSSTAEASTTAVPTTTTALSTTAPSTTASSTTAGGGRLAPGSPEAAAAEAYAVVFDSAASFEQKAPHLEDADALQSTVETYAAGAAAFNGFRVDVTAVTVTGDTAAVTYDLYFGTTKQYSALPGTVVRRDGTWVVARDEFCGFMASARTPCA